MPKRSLAIESKKQSKIKKIAEAAHGDGCAHPFNLTSLGYSTDDELIRVCNLCHHTWHELCSNNVKIVLRKETKDGPHVGRRYFQCTDKHDAGDKFFSWFDRSTGQRATRQQYLFPSVSDLLKRRKFDEDDVAAIMSIHQSTGDSSIGKQSSDDSDYSQPADDESVSEEEEEK